MNRFSVELAPGAEADIREACTWYREGNALIADAFRAEVFDSIDRIAEAPLARPADKGGNRKRVLHRFPYSVIYEIPASTSRCWPSRTIAAGRATGQRRRAEDHTAPVQP